VILDPSTLLFSELTPIHVRPHLTEATNQCGKVRRREIAESVGSAMSNGRSARWEVRFCPLLGDEQVRSRHRHVEYLSHMTIRHVNSVEDRGELPCETHPHQLRRTRLDTLSAARK
jgi:hypothetical protein